MVGSAEALGTDSAPGCNPEVSPLGIDPASCTVKRLKNVLPHQQPGTFQWKTIIAGVEVTLVDANHCPGGHLHP